MHTLGTNLVAWHYSRSCDMYSHTLPCETLSSPPLHVVVGSWPTSLHSFARIIVCLRVSSPFSRVLGCNCCSIVLYPWFYNCCKNCKQNYTSVNKWFNKHLVAKEIRGWQYYDMRWLAAIIHSPQIAGIQQLNCTKLSRERLEKVYLKQNWTSKLRIYKCIWRVGNVKSYHIMEMCKQFTAMKVVRRFLYILFCSSAWVTLVTIALPSLDSTPTSVSIWIATWVSIMNPVVFLGTLSSSIGWAATIHHKKPSDITFNSNTSVHWLPNTLPIDMVPGARSGVLKFLAPSSISWPLVSCNSSSLAAFVARSCDKEALTTLHGVQFHCQKQHLSCKRSLNFGTTLTFKWTQEIH